MIQQRLVLAFDHLESADAASDVDADLFSDLGRHFQAAVAHGEIRRRDGGLDESPYFLNFFFLDIVGRIGALHLARDPAVKASRVKTGDGADAATGSQHSLPCFYSADP